MQETQETRIQSLGQEDPLEEETATPVFLLGEFHEQGRLVGYSPRGLQESDTTALSTLTQHMQETWVQSLGWEDLLEDEQMPSHFSTHCLIPSSSDFTSNIAL